MSQLPFETYDWHALPKTEHPGETGTSYWQTIQRGGLRVRIVEYSAGYSADHWCSKGHIVHCLEGSFTSYMQHGNPVDLNEGMMYIVSDEMSLHRSVSQSGAKLLIIDGDFLAKST